MFTYTTDAWQKTPKKQKLTLNNIKYILIFKYMQFCLFISLVFLRLTFTDFELWCEFEQFNTYTNLKKLTFHLYNAFNIEVLNFYIEIFARKPAVKPFEMHYGTA